MNANRQELHHELLHLHELLDTYAFGDLRKVIQLSPDNWTDILYTSLCSGRAPKAVHATDLRLRLDGDLALQDDVYALARHPNSALLAALSEMPHAE